MYEFAPRANSAPPGSLPAPDEELWIIQKPAGAPEAEDEDKETPGCGTLLCKLPGQEQDVPIPLEHTDVHASIAGYIATVEVTQKYHNPYDGKIEAVYVFPLPQNAAVNEFLLTIGERKIRGIIRERAEAQKIYADAMALGLVASLLTQERPNIFTQKVANIEPGKRIDVNIKYFHTLAYADGWYEFVFPMVVGPRFNPPGYSEGVAALSRGKSGRSGQQTEVQYLRPDERSGHDIALQVDVNAGVQLEALESRSHVIAVNRPTPEKVRVELSPLDRIPNRDFVLHYKIAGPGIKSAVVTHHDERGGFFTLMLYPPEDLESLPRAPMEMVFVLDCSGSMSGEPLAQAKRAVKWALKDMRPDDTFQIIRFSNKASQLGDKPLPATPKNVRRALWHVGSLRGSGGTMMVEGIKAALDFPHDPKRLRFVAFLTDGYIGNEKEILQAMRERLGASRVFSFGIGSAPNDYLLTRMARLGRGVVARVGLNDNAADVMEAFFQRVSHPALKDIEIDWGAWNVTEVYPSEVPDLFVGRPVILTGRYAGQAAAPIRISGTVGDERRVLAVQAAGEPGGTNSGLPCVWARAKIADLINRAIHESVEGLPQQIKEIALEYNLLSAYTAFVTVDSLSQTAGDHGTTVVVPVPVPEGVKYETTVDRQ